jgi:hypothetical protein
MHAGTTAAMAYREGQREAMLVGQLPEFKWLYAEAQRARNKVRNRRRYGGDRWLLPGIVLMFGDKLEVRFQSDLCPVLSRHHLYWDGVPDGHRDQLRFAWRRFVLDRPYPDAWRAKAEAAMLDLKLRCDKRGGSDLPELIHADGTEDFVVRIERAPPAYSKRRRLSERELADALNAPRRVLERHQAEANKLTPAEARKADKARADMEVKANAALGPMTNARIARRQQLVRECRVALDAAAAEHQRFDLEQALSALERVGTGDPEAWIDYLAGLAKPAPPLPPHKLTRREKVLAARWDPTI